MVIKYILLLNLFLSIIQCLANGLCGYFPRKYQQNAGFQTINPLLDDKILDRSKLKQIADDIFKCI